MLDLEPDLPDLHLAAALGDLPGVKESLSDLAWLNRPAGECEATPLHFAVDGGHLEAVKLLLDAGAEPEVLDDECITPLVYAIINGREDIVRLLVERGADVNYHIAAHGIPLTNAIYSNRLRIFKFLVESGARTDACDWRDFTPLMASCCDGRFEMVKILLENQADPELRNCSGQTPEYIARLYGHPELAELFPGPGPD